MEASLCDMPLYLHKNIKNLAVKTEITLHNIMVCVVIGNDIKVQGWVINIINQMFVISNKIALNKRVNDWNIISFPPENTKLHNIKFYPIMSFVVNIT